MSGKSLEQAWEVLRQWSVLHRGKQKTGGLDDTGVDREGILQAALLISVTLAVVGNLLFWWLFPVTELLSVVFF